MRKLLGGFGLGLFLLGSFLLSNTSINAQEPKVLRWALIPAREAALEMELWKPIGEYLERELGIPVKMTISSDVSAAIQAIKFGHADLARTGGFGYLFALSQTEVEPLVREVQTTTGRDHYYSLIIVQRYSSIQTLEDLKGRSFAFVDPASTSGCLVPKTILIKAGFDLERDLGRTFYTQAHGASILAVQKGKVDAAAVAEIRLLDAIEKGMVRESEMVVIHRSKPICTALMMVRKDLSENFKEAIRKAFIQMPKDLASNYGVRCSYTEAKDEDYDPLREIAEVLKLDLSKK